MFKIRQDVKLTRVGEEISIEDLKNIETIISDNQYDEVWECIGFGCFGTVYKYKSSDGIDYAIKIAKKYSNEAMEHSYDVESLLELRGHRHIPKIHAYDINVNDARCFVMVVDYVYGVTFCNYDYDYDLNIDFVNSFEDTLKYIVSKGFKISDIHGNNIIIDSMTGHLIIIDFGGIRKADIVIGLENDAYLQAKIGEVKYVYRSYLERKNRILNNFYAV